MSAPCEQPAEVLRGTLRRKDCRSFISTPSVIRSWELFEGMAEMAHVDA